MKTRERKTPPGRNPAAQRNWTSDSAFNGIGSLPILALGGGHRQPHLLRDRARKEPANGMRLPAGGSHQLLGGCACLRAIDCPTASPIQRSRFDPGQNHARLVHTAVDQSEGCGQHIESHCEGDRN